MQDNGIQQLISCPHTPQQNGLAERKHRHLTELGLSMLFQSKLLLKYWVESFFTANFLSNLLPTSTLDGAISPYEKIHGKAPNYIALRSFGCACFPTLRDYAATKLDPKSLQCVFLGYNEKYKGYRCLCPPTGRVYINRHVIFDETTYPFATIYRNLHPQAVTPLLSAWDKGFIPPVSPNKDNEHSASLKKLNNAASTSTGSVYTSQIVPVFNEINFPTLQSSSSSSTVSAPLNTTTDVNEECSERTTGFDPAFIGDSASHSQTSMLVSPANDQSSEDQSLQPSVSNTHSMTTRAKSRISKPNPKYAMLSHKVSYPEPKTVTSALKDSGWNGAMTEEMNNCKETNTWSLVPYTPDMNVLGSKWGFRTKLNADGTLDKLKARLVAKGFDQEEGIDYLETYSPVVITPTVRMVLQLATTMSWELKQMDVKNAFLHGDLKETVYMMQPAGFIDKDRPDHVCHLHKALYGLKQAPRAWFDNFSTFLLEFGFICSLSDPSLFVYAHNGNVILLLLYVDDMIITGNSSRILTQLLEELNKQFRMKDMGKVHYFLGIQFQHHQHGMFMSHQKYAEDLLIAAGMEDCLPISTPLPLQLDRVTHQQEEFSDPTYF